MSTVYIVRTTVSDYQLFTVAVVTLAMHILFYRTSSVFIGWGVASKPGDTLAS